MEPVRSKTRPNDGRVFLQNAGGQEITLPDRSLAILGDGCWEKLDGLSSVQHPEMWGNQID